MDFYEAFNYLFHADIFDGRFLEGLDLMPVKLNPETNEIDKDSALNTKTEIWLEHGPYDAERSCWCHDIDLDCVGDSFEEAIIRLALLVKEKYYTEKPYTKVSDDKLISCKAIIF